MVYATGIDSGTDATMRDAVSDTDECLVTQLW